MVCELLHDFANLLPSVPLFCSEFRKLHLQDFEPAVTLSPREIKRRLSWQDGKLLFQGETLAEAVAEFNRYNERQLVIEYPGITGWQLGGTFQARDLDTFIAALERTFDLRAEAMPNEKYVIELRRR